MVLLFLLLPHISKYFHYDQGNMITTLCGIMISSYNIAYEKTPHVDRLWVHEVLTHFSSLNSLSAAKSDMYCLVTPKKFKTKV